MSTEKFELVISRKPNYTALGLRTLPIKKGERDRLQLMLTKLD